MLFMHGTVGYDVFCKLLVVASASGLTAAREISPPGRRVQITPPIQPTQVRPVRFSSHSGWPHSGQPCTVLPRSGSLLS